MDPTNPPILRLGDPRLRRRSREVTSNAEVASAVAALHRRLERFRREHGFGRAIAAPQLGIDLRLIALNLDGKPSTIFNPQIVARSERTITLWDDCLSFPDLLVRVRRRAAVRVRFVDEQGREHDWSVDDPEVSELVQHEVDHLDGVLATDHAIDREAIVLRPVFEESPEYFRRQVDLWYER